MNTLKSIKPSILVLLIIIVVAIVGFGAKAMADAFIAKKPATEVTCTTLGQSHQVTIQGNRVIPEHTNAKLCDTLIITNDDTSKRLMAFGHHDHHIAYDGVTEKLLLHGGILKVTLNKTGTYTFHDHYQDEVEATFTVTD